MTDGVRRLIIRAVDIVGRMADDLASVEPTIDE